LKNIYYIDNYKNYEIIGNRYFLICWGFGWSPPLLLTG